jgi:hypothetical protein
VVSYRPQHPRLPLVPARFQLPTNSKLLPNCRFFDTRNLISAASQLYESNDPAHGLLRKNLVSAILECQGFSLLAGHVLCFWLQGEQGGMGVKGPHVRSIVLASRGDAWGLSVSGPA